MDSKGLQLIPCTIGGSPTHYYHFLLGFVIPLLEEREFIWNKKKYSSIHSPSFGPMNRLLEELDLPGLQIAPASRSRGILTRIMTRWLGRRGFKLHIPCGDFRSKMFLPGRDGYFRYSREVFQQTKNTVRELLHQHWERAVHLADQDYAATSKRILLVQRGVAPKDDQDRNSTRRSIPNMAEIAAAIDHAYGGCVVIELENCSLAQQVALFGQADAIIAQHGAALSNLVWARPTTKVVEIHPATFDMRKQRLDHFGYLCRCMGLAHERVHQDTAHAPTPPQSVVAALDRLYSD